MPLYPNTFSWIVILLTVLGGTILLGRTSWQKHRIQVQHSLLAECLFDRLEPSRIFTKRHNTGQYNVLRFSHNLRVDVMPAAIVLVEDTDQVSLAVRCAYGQGVRVCARSGQHSYEGYSTCHHGLIIDLREMNSLALDSETKVAKVGPGMTLGQLDYQLWNKHELMVPTGTCHTVGVGGFVLGGGIGLYARQLGLLADNLLGITMVDCQGDVIRATKEENPDLLWASQGGGGGQFGIVTEFTLQTHSHPSDGRVTWHKMFWSMEKFQDVLAWWTSQAPIAPRSLFLQLSVNPQTKVVQTVGHFAGPKTQLDAWIGSSGIKNLLPVTDELLETVDYLTSTLDAANLPRGNTSALLVDRHARTSFKYTSVMGYNLLSKDSLELLEAHLIERPVYNQDDVELFLFFDPFGGAISDLGNANTAFPHRQGVGFMCQMILSWGESVPQRTVDELLRWQQELRSILLRDLKGAYQNYADEDLYNFMEDYYGENAERLRRVKRKYDPNNVFAFKQSIQF